MRNTRIFKSILAVVSAMLIVVTAVVPVAAAHDHGTAWDKPNSLPTEGNYYLTTDVALPAGVALTDDLTLCLNGHSIYAAPLAMGEMTAEEILDAAYALAKGATLAGTHTLKGEVTEINYAYSSSYNNISVTIKVDGDPDGRSIYCYRMKGGSDLAVGDTIIVTGTIKNYNGTVEFDQGCTYELAEELSVEEIMDAAYALPSGATMPGTQTLTGTITKIDTAYSAQYGNITVTIKVEGEPDDRTIICYRMKGDGANTLKVGDKIVVTGEIINYSGKIEFNFGCTFEFPSAGSEEEEVEYVTPKEIVEAAYALGNGKSLKGDYTLTGKITMIDTPYSSKYNNISVVIEVAGFADKPMLCYRLKGGAGLKVGDIITVSGKIKNYYGKIEFDEGCTYVPVTAYQLTTDLISVNGHTLTLNDCVGGGVITASASSNIIGAKSGSTLNINDGIKITGNQVGTGIYVHGSTANINEAVVTKNANRGINVGSNGILNLGNVTITDNTSSENGAGLYKAGTGVVNMNGKVVISNNTKTGSGDSNFYLTTGKTFNIISLEEGSNVNISLPSSDTAIGRKLTTVCDTDYSKYVHSDNADYGVSMNVEYILVLSEPKTEKSARTGYIYVNEKFHAFLTGGRFIAMPHTENGTGFCPVCKAEIAPTVIDDTTPEGILSIAYGLKDGEITDEEYTLTGTIVSVNTPYSSQYKNVTVTIEVEENEDRPVMCYRLKGEGADTLKVGDVITVTGKFKNYKGTVEFDAGCTFTLDFSAEVQDTSKLSTKEVINLAYALPEGASTPAKYTLTGKIVSVDTEYSAQYDNVTVTIEVEGFKNYPIKCFRLSGGSELKAGDVITVTGTFYNYYGTIEFAQGCTYTK